MQMMRSICKQLEVFAGPPEFGRVATIQIECPKKSEECHGVFAHIALAVAALSAVAVGARRTILGERMERSLEPWK